MNGSSSLFVGIPTLVVFAFVALVVVAFQTKSRTVRIVTGTLATLLVLATALLVAAVWWYLSHLDFTF